jgi:hypothetical protein
VRIFRLRYALHCGSVAVVLVIALQAALRGGASEGTGGAIRPPATGAYLGAWTSANTGYTLKQREAQIGRRYKIAHFYHGWNEAGRFPTRYERKLARGGRYLYLAWRARRFNTNGATAWADIAAGRHDAAIDAEAAKIASFRRPVFMDFSQEPELEIEAGGYGSARDFAAAYRHIVQRFRRHGATNVAWVWSVTGFEGYHGHYTGGLYPGDDVVDWIAWDPYNWYACNGSPWRSFAATVSPFYGWLTAHGHGNKPFMLAEFGSSESEADARAKGRWFAGALDTLKSGAFPNLKALVYFDSRPAECDWRIDTSRASLRGYRRLAGARYLNP